MGGAPPLWYGTRPGAANQAGSAQQPARMHGAGAMAALKGMAAARRGAFGAWRQPCRAGSAQAVLCGRHCLLSLRGWLIRGQTWGAGVLDGRRHRCSSTQPPRLPGARRWGNGHTAARQPPRSPSGPCLLRHEPTIVAKRAWGMILRAPRLPACRGGGCPSTMLAESGPAFPFCLKSTLVFCINPHSPVRSPLQRGSRGRCERRQSSAMESHELLACWGGAAAAGGSAPSSGERAAPLEGAAGAAIAHKCGGGPPARCRPSLGARPALVIPRKRSRRAPFCPHDFHIAVHAFFRCCRARQLRPGSTGCRRRRGGAPCPRVPRAGAPGTF